MDIKRVCIPMLTAIIIASQLMGCSALNKTEMNNALHSSSEVEIVIPSLASDVKIDTELGEEQSILWEELASLTLNESIRDSWDDTLGITLTETGKNGILYVDAEGNNVNNNTLRVALHNREFQKVFTASSKEFNALVDAVESNYIDVDVDDPNSNEQKTNALYMGINAYFNLLADNTEMNANPTTSITNAEFMAMVMRAETPVDDSLTVDPTFESAVGQNELNLYAQKLVDNTFLSLEDGSLNTKTYNNSISRGEAIYILMDRYFHDELENFDASKITLLDAKDAGDIASKQKFTGTEQESLKVLSHALSNPDKGAPTDIYKALCLAEQKGIINDETKWENALTRQDGIGLLVFTLMQEDGVAEFSAKLGKVEGYEVNLEDTSSTETSAGVDSEGSDAVFTEGEYQGNDLAEESQGTTSAPKVEGQLSDEEVLSILKADLDAGKMSQEEYDLMVEALASVNQKMDEAMENIANSQSQGTTHINTGAAEKYSTEGLDTEHRTNIQYGQGDYSGLEHIRIN